MGETLRQCAFQCVERSVTSVVVCCVLCAHVNAETLVPFGGGGSE